MDGTDSSRQAEETRTEILCRAQELFTHYGFSKTNVGDIAAACSMSPGNLYRYYRNKQAIGLAVVTKYFAMSEAAMETGLMLPVGTPESRIRALIETGVGHLVDEMRKSPKIVELADFLCTEEEGVALLERHITWKRDRIAREVAGGIEQGLFREGDPRQMAVAVLTATKVFWMPPALAHWRDKETVLPELRQVLDLIFEGLRRR